MSRHLWMLLAAAPILGLSLPAQAQTGASVAADAKEQPLTDALNAGGASAAAASNATTAAMQDQYELDRARFRAEAAARREKMTDDDVAYAKQQQAYADAMHAWRIQTDECKRGILKSCKKPTPVPADFYIP